jgi:hypothetical protein
LAAVIGIGHRVTRIAGLVDNWFVSGHLRNRSGSVTFGKLDCQPQQHRGQPSTGEIQEVADGGKGYKYIGDKSTYYLRNS